MHTTVHWINGTLKDPITFWGPPLWCLWSWNWCWSFTSGRHQKNAYLFQQGKSCSGQLVENMPLDMDLKLKLPFRNCKGWNPDTIRSGNSFIKNQNQISIGQEIFKEFFLVFNSSKTQRKHFLVSALVSKESDKK